MRRRSELQPLGLGLELGRATLLRIRLRPSGARFFGLLVMLLSTAVWAQGYVRTQIPNTDICIYWANRQITYHVDAAGSAQTPGDTEFTAIDAAFQSWQTVSDYCSDFQFVRGDRLTDPPVGYIKGSSNNVDVLTFREKSCDDIPPTDPCFTDDSCANTYRCWIHDPSVIALTTTTFNTKTGEILDADVEFNAAPQYGGPGFLFTTVDAPPCDPANVSTDCVAIDVQNTLTHEIGHMIGLAHDPDPSSTMNASAQIGDTNKRIIDVGTARGFCDIYPKGQLSSSACDLTAQLPGKVTATSAGTAIGCDSGGASPTWLSCLLLALAFFGWRRRAERG